MARTESSVTVSLGELLETEERRRKDEILAARRRELEAERLEAEERARTDRLAREELEARVQAARELAARQREEQVRLEALREAELERARIAAELDAKLALISAETARDQERLAFERDRRIGRLSVLAVVFGALSAVLLLGSAALWAFMWQPAQTELRAELARAEKASADLGEQAKQEQSRLRAELSESQAKVRELEAELGRLKRASSFTPSPAGARGGRPAPTPAKACTCDPNDPMCDCWRSPPLGSTPAAPPPSSHERPLRK
jgi:colicin import membrane protein